MIIVLNGPLGIGKSTLAEALSESIDGCVMLDGDHLVAANPPYVDELKHLHSTVAVLVTHHQSFGYRHFVLNHVWTSPADLDELRTELGGLDQNIRIFRLTLPIEENLRRIERRASTRAIDERDFESQTFAAEFEALNQSHADELGEPFDMSASPSDLVKELSKRLGLT